MCFYITATLPKGTDLNKFRHDIEKFEMAFKVIQNDNINSQLRPGELYLRATKSYCDCDTILGSLNRQNEYQTLLNSKKVKTLRKKKWTDEEIDNWINQKLKNKKGEVGRKLTQNERNSEVERWHQFILNILENSNVSHVGILKHWYHGALEDENITLKETRRIQNRNITPDFLLNLEEDILYEFYIPYNS